MPLYALGPTQPKTPAPDRYWIAPTATVIGDVHIGEDVGIWFGAVLRGDNEPILLGDGTNIQEGVMIHNDKGFPVAIGAGCTIGENSLVGMGATILNGARIGNNCLVGANALVTEGKEFPDNSLIVGSPAKVVRTLDEAAVASLRKSAAQYVDRWKLYARDLRPL